MKSYNQLDRDKQWQIISATSLLGMMQRASKMDVQLSATDDIFCTKKVTFTQLIKLKHSNLIRDYFIRLSPDGMYNTIEIFFNDGSILERAREITFRL